MPILALPVEILLEIVEESRPDGFEGLASTSKRFFTIARRLIKSHNCLKKVYSSPSLGLWPSHSCNKLIYDVLLDPLVARYSKYLRCPHLDLCRPHDNLIKYCLDQKDVVRDFIE